MSNFIAGGKAKGKGKRRSNFVGASHHGKYDEAKHCRIKGKFASCGHGTARTSEAHPGRKSAKVSAPKANTSRREEPPKTEVHPDVLKAQGASLDKVRRAHADMQERRVRDAVGGTWLKDYEPHDVLIEKRGGVSHAVEVKSLIFGEKRKVSVHPGALENKVDDALAHPRRVYHTVALDTRRTAEGGAHASRYSGHEIYYKRACGPYSLSKMYKCKNMTEVKRLIATPDHLLPEAARGEFPTGQALAKLRVDAAADRDFNNTRSKERKRVKGKAAYGG